MSKINGDKKRNNLKDRNNAKRRLMVRELRASLAQHPAPAKKSGGAAAADKG